MSSQGMYWAMSRKGLTAEQKLLLIFMGDVTPMDGWSKTDRGYLAECMETTVADVERILDGLVADEIVKRDGASIYLAGADILTKR